MRLGMAKPPWFVARIGTSSISEGRVAERQAIQVLRSRPVVGRRWHSCPDRSLSARIQGERAARCASGRRVADLHLTLPLHLHLELLRQSEAWLERSPIDAQSQCLAVSPLTRCRGVLARIGLTQKEAGVTFHGLRTQWAIEQF